MDTVISWVTVLTPSFTVITPKICDEYSRSGADENVKTPLELITKDTSPEPPFVVVILKVSESPSSSEAVTVPIVVWFSAALKVDEEVNAGASLTLVTLTVISWVVVLVPSLAVTVAV